VADAAGAIRFYPDGGSSGGGVVVRDGGRRFIVLVDWLSGNISVVRDATSH
jgi:general secretion pathway protein H